MTDLPTTPRTVTPTRHPSTSATLLLIERSRPLARALTLALRRHGYGVIVAGHPLAVPGRLYGRHAPSVVVLDPDAYCPACLLAALRAVPALRLAPVVSLAGRPLDFRRLLAAVDRAADHRPATVLHAHTPHLRVDGAALR